MTTIIDLIRHGEPVGGQRYRGRTDDPLSEKGWNQMWTAVGDYRGWQQIVSSPLLRCAGFAHELGRILDIPVSIDERLAELGYGEWEGKTPEELTAHDPDLLLRYRRDPLNNRPSGAEELEGFASRVSAAWGQISEQQLGRHALVVAHAGVIRMIMAQVLAMPLSHLFRIQVGNAAISRFMVEGEGADALASLIFHDGRLAR
ncbi:histidine phosphatase family protein [Sulfuricella sp.]|uniref:histidine phosphatase family protein n=1 Tax=Sulfuricella sp. TaxID=2099377 RepID=UPI002B8B9EEF|nr:histidine phosphatase family protein [Sulfuricella sp.]HUX63780.1 histidine phosphatase family protein [Sulfuricella sp.]